MKQKSQVVINRIARGEVDEDLDVILATITRRKIQLKQNPGFRPGDVVRFNSQIGPAYLRGKLGVVLQFVDGNLQIRVEDRPSSRYYAGRTA